MDHQQNEVQKYERSEVWKILCEDYKTWEKGMRYQV